MAVNGIEIKVGQRWKTRGGYETTVDGYDPASDTPWQLERYHMGCRITGSVTSSGHRFAGLTAGSHPDDLAELISDDDVALSDLPDTAAHHVMVLPVADVMTGPDLEQIRSDRESWNSPSELDIDPLTHPSYGGKKMLLPSDPAARKGMPITTGVLDYFPLAIAEVSIVSKAGNDQHNPGQPLHWAKGKSMDHADCIPRHLIDRGSRDTDGMRHSAKLAWRALALLQTELEDERVAAVQRVAPDDSEGGLP
jgi:hypothetical protein